MPPRLGMRRRIGRKAGSLMRIKEICDHSHELVPRVDHVEGDQPGHHHGGEHQVEVEPQGLIEDDEQGAHLGKSLVG